VLKCQKLKPNFVGIGEALHVIKHISREPKRLHQVDSTLEKYSQTACSNTGAFLLSVVGGKLLGGINFANALCYSGGIAICGQVGPVVARKAQIMQTFPNVLS
jgi:hypothetical protein